jgi:hypothetical protein
VGKWCLESSSIWLYLANTVATHAFSFKAAVDRFPEITASSINFNDACTADRWKSNLSADARKARSTWHWVQEYKAYQRIPNRFEIAVKRGVLGGLCYGQPSASANRLRLNLIESTPIRPTPLGMRAFPIIAFAAATYADIIGATELWILDPDPNLEGLYMGQGFSGRTYYHGKRVGQLRVL